MKVAEHALPWIHVVPSSRTSANRQPELRRDADRAERARIGPDLLQKAWEIHVEFERERPRLMAAADAGFPVPDSIPFELEDPK